MEYLLKVSVITALFYSCYMLFLQRTTFFEQNRWFLLLGIVTALTLPLVTITNSIEKVPIKVFETENSPILESTEFILIPNVKENIVDIPIIKESTSLDLLDVLQLVYVLGVLFFTVRFLIQLSSLLRFIFTSKRIKQDHFTFVEIEKKCSPFSFFNWIVYNPKGYIPKELEQIQIHEKVHATQKHTVDVLLMQLSCVLLWFNPFIWLYNSLVKQNLEFIADAKTQKQIDCKQLYQLTLLKETVKGQYIQLSNLFYSSLIKKRIAMLNKEKSKKIHFIKYSFVLPLLAVFFMNFNVNEVYKENRNGDYQEFIFLSSFSEAKVHEFQSKLEILGYDFKIKEIERNQQNQIKSIDFNVTKNGVKGEYRNFTTSALEPIAVQYFEKQKKINIQKLSFIRTYELISENKNSVEIIIGEEKDTKYLNNLKKDLKRKYNIDFTYSIKKDVEYFGQQEFSYSFNKRRNGYTINTHLKEKLGIKFDPDKELLVHYSFTDSGDFTYGLVFHFQPEKIYVISKEFSNESLKQIITKLKKQNIDIKFSNIKRNNNNEIISISMVANSGIRRATFNADNTDLKKAIDPIAIKHSRSFFTISPF